MSVTFYFVDFQNSASTSVFNDEQMDKKIFFSKRKVYNWRESSGKWYDSKVLFTINLNLWNVSPYPEYRLVAESPNGPKYFSGRLKE